MWRQPSRANSFKDIVHSPGFYNPAFTLFCWWLDVVTCWTPFSHLKTRTRVLAQTLRVCYRKPLFEQKSLLSQHIFTFLGVVYDFVGFEESFGRWTECHLLKRIVTSSEVNSFKLFLPDLLSSLFIPFHLPKQLDNWLASFFRKEKVAHKRIMGQFWLGGQQSGFGYKSEFL